MTGDGEYNKHPEYAIEYKYGGGSFALETCDECGAIVLGSKEQARHSKWHEKLEYGKIW